MAPCRFDRMTILALFACVALQLGIVSAKGGTDRGIQIVNESGRRVEIYWVHASTGELVKQSDPFIFNGASFNLSSFAGHKFQVRELPGQKSGLCGDADSEDRNCRITYFTVNTNYDQVVFVKKGITVEHQDEKSVARADALQTLEDCQAKAKRRLLEDSSSAESIYDDLLRCLEDRVTEKLEKAADDVAFQSKLRDRMGELVERYTCNDEKLNSTVAESSKAWKDKRSGESYAVDIMHDRDHSQIHVVRGFASEEECAAIVAAAATSELRPSKENPFVDESITADVAHLAVPWTDLKNKMSVVGRRMFDYAYFQLKVPIWEAGQEDLLVAKFSDGSPDQQILPHCDGKCSDGKAMEGDRVATIIVNCEIPTKGGAYNFRNAGLRLLPQVGDAIYISYMSKDKTSDKGFTEYSSCPVLEGAKQIAVQYLRQGVSKTKP